jgi:nuclear mRNA export protein SAC3
MIKISGQPSPALLPKSTTTLLPPSGQQATVNQATPAPGPPVAPAPLGQIKSTTVAHTTSVTAPITKMPKSDPMDKFARWILLADSGMLEDLLEPLAVEHVLKSTWEEFKAVEEERIRREKDEKSWAEALKFRHYNLKVRYFYRWLDTCRKRRVVKRIQLAKEEARKWKSPSSVAEREAAERAKKEKELEEAKELIRMRTSRHSEDVSRLRESTRSNQSLEDALLATGVFSGVRDERAAARQAAQDDQTDSMGEISPSATLRLRSENRRRLKRGLPPLKRFPEATYHKDGSKTALLRAISSGRDSLSMSTGSLRNSTFSSSYRSSLGFNQSRVRKSQASVKDPYWRLKANGLVQMPNGEYLHESLALPMLQEGKRFPGIGDYGLPPVKSHTPSETSPADLNIARDSDSPSPTPNRFDASNETTRSPSALEGVAQKRKRGFAEDEDLAAYRNEAPATRKRAKSSDHSTPATPGGDQEFLASIANLLSRVDEVANS